MQLKRHHSPARDEGGVALVVAIIVALVVVLLSTSAIEQSVNTVTQAGIAGKQVSSTDAAEAGIQYEYNQIVARATLQASTFSCPSVTTLASTGNFKATYTLSYALSTAPTTWTSCVTGTSYSLASGTTYLIRSTGDTTAHAIGAKTYIATVTVPSGLVGAKSGYFPEAVYAGQDLTDNPKDFDLTKAATGASADTYTGYVGQCGNRSYHGNYTDPYDIVTPSSLPPNSVSNFTGTCTVAGNLTLVYPNGVTSTPASPLGVTLTGGTGVGGNIVTNGLVSITKAQANVGGSISASGSVSICTSGPVTIAGSITNGDTTNGLIFCNTNPGSSITYVNGDINSAGPIDGGSTSVAGVLYNYGSFGTYANGPINLINSYIQGSLYGETSITTSGTQVNGLLIAGGAITLTNDVTYGGIQGQAAVTLNGGVYNGSVMSEGLLTIEGGAKVTGTIYSQGGINFVGGTQTAYSGGNVTLLGGTSGSLTNVEDEYGTVSCNSNPIAGGLYYYSATLSTCVAGARGPTSITSFSAAFSSTSVPDTPNTPYNHPPDDFPTSPNNPYMGIGGATLSLDATSAHDLSNVQSSIVAAVTAAANTINNTSGVTSGLCSSDSLPCVNFPSLTYDANSWLANTSFCGTATVCSTATMNLETTTNCNSSGTGSLYNDVAALAVPGVLPTVIVTNCVFNTGGTTGFPIYNNVAVFDTAGFDFPSYTTGWYSGDGNVHQLFLIVPSGSTYASGDATCSTLGSGTTSGPDIVINGNMTDGNIEDFLYTPNNVCSQSSVTLNGRVYAGQDVDAAAGYNWEQTFYDISPWVATTGSSSLLGIPAITSVSQAANPAGTT